MAYHKRGRRRKGKIWGKIKRGAIVKENEDEEKEEKEAEDTWAFTYTNTNKRKREKNMEEKKTVRFSLQEYEENEEKEERRNIVPRL